MDVIRNPPAAGEERRLNAENEKREEDGSADQMEKSESHPVGGEPA